MDETNTTLLLIIIILALIILGKFKFELRLGKEKKAGDSLNKVDSLSNSEVKILKFLSEGKTNQEIAEDLSISTATVKKHVSNIFKKLEISSRTEARKYRDIL